MAGPMPLQGDRAAWCRERLDFFCAVISNLDRESLKVELEACETEEEAEGLMHSLFWLQDNMDTNQTGGAAAAEPSAPDANVIDDKDVLEAPHIFAAEDPPALQPMHQDEARHGFFYAAALEPDVFIHEAQHLRYPEPQDHYEYEPLNEQEQEESDVKDYQNFPPAAQFECHILPHEPHLEHHNFLPQQEQQQQQHEHQQEQQHEEEEAEFVCAELPSHTNTPDLTWPHDPHEPPRSQELPKDHSADDPSVSEDHEEFEDVYDEEWGAQTDPLPPEELAEDLAQAEPLPPEELAEDLPVAAGGIEDGTEPIDPTSEKSDPYFDAEEPSTEDFVDVEEPLEDDSIMSQANHEHSNAAAVGGQDMEGGDLTEDRVDEQRLMEHDEATADQNMDGATGGVSENEETTMDDEKVAKELSEAINAEEWARMESDERLARELSEELEREERRREAADEELARILAGEMEAEETEERTCQQRQNNPPVEIIFAEADDNPPPPEQLQEIEQDVAADEEMARQLDAEAGVVHMRKQQEEEEKAGRVAALINMFPDADPTYLTERMEDVETEEAFRQLVEVLLQCQRTEPRMTGYQKLLKQSQVAHHNDQQPPVQEHTQAAALASTDATCAFVGPVIECTICFEEEVPVKDMGSCNALYNYHEFCIECIRKHVAALIGQGHSSFRCMNGYCEAEFSWRTLRRVMDPVVYRKVQERRQQEEVMAAGVENLVSCPFCCFMVIMPDPENKVLECLNPECLKESCRVCKELSHIPLRCEEVERETQKDARTMLENKMAEAMIRQCPKCGKRFVTEGGCNKMTCSCGTIMCYLCKRVITEGYQHFEQRGNVASSKCPLWSNATELHTGEVRLAAEEGRQELEPGMTLVYDPTREVLQ